MSLVSVDPVWPVGRVVHAAQPRVSSAPWAIYVDRILQCPSDLHKLEDAAIDAIWWGTFLTG